MNYVFIVISIQLTTFKRGTSSNKMKYIINEFEHNITNYRCNEYKLVAILYFNA